MATVLQSGAFYKLFIPMITTLFFSDLIFSNFTVGCKYFDMLNLNPEVDLTNTLKNVYLHFLKYVYLRYNLRNYYYY